MRAVAYHLYAAALAVSFAAGLYDSAAWLIVTAALAVIGYQYAARQ